MNSIREEALEDGITIGEERGSERLIKSMLGKGKSPEEIADLTDVPLADVLKYSK
ncbi:MAG: hypothetical protein IJ695_08240 [Butyrivibrio sp.]|nr:hypothetical protein [Butyrivibrio sp.]